MLSFTIQLDLHIPPSSAAAFAEAMTGDDNDVILAAETAIRERLNVDEVEQVEISVDDNEDAVKAELKHFCEGSC